MAGYIAAILDESDISKCRKLFKVSETVVVPLDRGKVLVYVSPGRTINRDRIFQGYAIDHAREEMIFANAESQYLPDPSRPVDGSYFTGAISGERVRFGGDSFGFMSMMWFTDRRLSAVSDSYLSLIALRKEFGLPCTPDLETIRGRMWLNSMSYQQLGKETYCREIRYCTPGTELVFSGELSLMTEEPLNLHSFYEAGIETHAEAVRESATRMVKLFKSYIEAGGFVNLSLSGGTDSRVCLGAALAADIEENLNIGSVDNGGMDFAVATELSQSFQFALNQPLKILQEGELKRRDRFASWAGSSLGIYDALYSPGSYRKISTPVFSVAGHGAEAAKGNYGWRSVNAIKMPREGKNQAGRGLESIGIDPKDKWSGEWHYLAFRNAIHGGRATQGTDYVCRPIAQVPLIGLSRSTANEFPAPKKSDPSLVLDTLIILNPSLAAHRFDDPKKDIERREIDLRLKRLGGELDTGRIEAYAIRGTATPSDGSCETHLEIARTFGFTGGMSPQKLLPKALDVAGRAKELVPASVQSYLDSISPGDKKPVVAARRESATLGKLLGIGTVL